MITEYESPSELEGHNYEKILSEMMKNVPDKYDKTEGGFVWDMIVPAALEADELINVWLELGLKTNYHMWAGGRWLDYHASDCGLTRRVATHSYGELRIETSEAVTIEAGFIFSVPSENGTAAIDFEALGAHTIEGVGTIPIRAVEAGTGGNVPAGAISIMKNPVKGVKSISNGVMTGGTAAESDESLRQRIDDFYGGRGASFVGNVADYKRWALSVAGVGRVHVIPLYAGANTVKILLADSTGSPANSEICKEAERYIFGESHYDEERLAPIGVAQYEVAPFSKKSFSVEADIKLAEDYTLEVVRGNIEKGLKEKAISDGEVRHASVCDVIYHTAGVADYKNVKIDGGSDNIELSEEELGFAGEIVLHEY